MIKYTDEQIAELRDRYLKGDTYANRLETIEELAASWGKSPRMLIAKLVKLGIYKAKSNQSTITGEKPITKEQLREKIEKKLEMELVGLEKSPKLTLLALMERLKDVREV